MKIEIKHDLDTNGMTPIVLVPLTNSDQKVTLYETDFDTLIKQGLYPVTRKRVPTAEQGRALHNRHALSVAAPGPHFRGVRILRREVR